MLPPTDSRLRPDQRHLENGEYDKANAEKLRLETRQRMVCLLPCTHSFFTFYCSYLVGKIVFNLITQTSCVSGHLVGFVTVTSETTNLYPLAL